jgi:hypothetical protein
MSKAMSHPTAQSIEHAATVASYGASGTAVFLGLTADEWGIAAAIFGILGVIATFAFNAWFKMKHHRG